MAHGKVLHQNLPQNFKIGQILGSLRALEASADFLIDECLFGMPKDSRKWTELTKHPNLRKKFGKPGVILKDKYAY